MICNSYVIYQSIEAAQAVWEAMELLPCKSINFSGVHYISNEAATANLELAKLKFVIITSDFV